MSNPLKSDNRYTITPEVSKGKLRPTLRFNGEYIARSPFRETLVLRAACHRAHLRGAITFENQPA